MYTHVLTTCLFTSLACSNLCHAQSLGQLAEQEKARRKAIEAPAAVIHERDLKRDLGQILPASEPSVASEDATERVMRVLPAQYRGGAVPEVPVLAVSGGEVLLEVTVSKEGRVSEVKTLRHTAPFTDALTAAVRGWQFLPAEDDAVPEPGRGLDPKARKAVESKVLVVGLFRPPALFAGTLGEPPADLAGPSEETPFPLAPARMPSFPPMALADGVVLAELPLDEHGDVQKVTILQSAAGFDAPALEAVGTLKLRPARAHGQRTPAFVYVVAAFRQPITNRSTGRPR